MVFERFKVLINTYVSSIEPLKESLSPRRLFCSRLLETHFHLSGCLVFLNQVDNKLPLYIRPELSTSDLWRCLNTLSYAPLTFWQHVSISVVLPLQIKSRYIAIYYKLQVAILKLELIIWELILWEVDFVRIDFVRIDLVGVDFMRIDLVGAPPCLPAKVLLYYASSHMYSFIC